MMPPVDHARALAAAAGSALLFVAVAAAGQPAQGAGADLRARFGLDLATKLASSPDPDERLRGLTRAAAIHTPDALSLLERASRARIPGGNDPQLRVEGAARRDPRALLVVVRGLSGWLDDEPARTALTALVDAPAQSFDARPVGAPSDDPIADEAEGAARIVLARQEAASALATSGNRLALEELIAMSRSAGAGQQPALDALAIHPPEPPLLGGVVLTTPATIALAVAVGDLRSLDAIEGTLAVSDPALRAAALEALGTAGDQRVAERARAALHDRDPRVRLAAGTALARLGAPDAPAAVEQLISDDATAVDGLRLAELVTSEGITKAAAARAAASGDDEVRTAAVTALGFQPSVSAVDALLVLAADPAIQGDAACAIARSPAPSALAALESLATAPGARRVAARAYFVRRFERRERSARLDALLAELAQSRDPRDRAVGLEALVAFGERSVSKALRDGDPAVRRAVALGANALGSPARAALMARWEAESDDTTRQVLAIGLAGGDPGDEAPSLDLVRRSRAGGPDAPLAVMVIAQRGDAVPGADVDALLSSRDPILRAHAAMGLGLGGAEQAVGRLARAYELEADASVRRAVVAALALLRRSARASPDWRGAMQWAAQVDPDREIRWLSARALAGQDAWGAPPRERVAWLRVRPATGATLPPAMTGMLVASDGVALPIAFDADGYALVPGVPAGEGQLRLAARVPAYEAGPP